MNYELNPTQLTTDLDKMKALVARMNQHRHYYYNLQKPIISDEAYDRLMDELLALEKQTGIVLSNSPTNTVGYPPVSALKKVAHPIPLLSLDKTKQEAQLLQMLENHDALLMLKLDGLTVKLCYENGELTEASTRGDGMEGEMITHNAKVFCNVPLSIPYKKRLVLSGEGLILNDDFEQLKEKFTDESGKSYRNSRNLASGSIRALNPEVCRERRIHFWGFHILEGLTDEAADNDSRDSYLQSLQNLGFDTCPRFYLKAGTTPEELKEKMRLLQDMAAAMQLPIDGLVLRYNSLQFSASCGRTGHHFKDGIAFKFEDETYETILRTIEWVPGRTGEIAPIGVFDTVEIDGCEVSRASLHNLSFIKDRELFPGCRILVSKRNMIIPHIEENLDRGHYQDMVPKTCPCCGQPTRIYSRKAEKERIVETLHCDNPDCESQILRKLLHFTEKKAMNLTGISEATLEKFYSRGFIRSFHDFYHLNRYRDKIIQMEGFGEKSYEKIQASVEASRNTSFANYLVAMDIPMIGRTASRTLDAYFHGSLKELEFAAVNRFDFTQLTDIGETMSSNIHEWFRNSDHLLLWRTLQKEFTFERKEEKTMTNTKNNPFTGCTIVATGKLEHFTRDGINSQIISLGATAGSSVTKKTDYLICGEKAGSKLAKAKELGITILTEQQFLDMIPA